MRRFGRIWGVVPEGVRIAIEASASGIFVYEYLDGRGREVHLAHPVYVKPFAKKHVKADKVDARVLAIEGVQPPKASDLFGKKGTKFLKEQEGGKR